MFALLGTLHKLELTAAIESEIGALEPFQREVLRLHLVDKLIIATSAAVLALAALQNHQWCL